MYDIYIAGPLFSDAERGFLQEICAAIEQSGLRCFLPHRDAGEARSPREVFEADYSALRMSNILVAWLDGAVIDDGTACELGIFSELCRSASGRRSVVTIVTDWRLRRRHAAGMPIGGTNLFVTGLLNEINAVICWNLEELVEAVRQLDHQKEK